MLNFENKVLVSILIPIYNAEKFIQNTIDSVLSQSFSDFELLLLDDYSNDNSAEVIKSYVDPRIKYVLCPHNFVNTLNCGLDLAKGKYIALLDHDDIMLPQRLELQYEYMELNPKVIACGGFMQSFGLYSKVLKAPLSYLEIIEKMICWSPMLNPTGFIRREILISNHIRYSSGYSFAADYKFWFDVIKIGKVVNIPEILTLYRTSNKQTSIVYGAESYEASTRIRLEIIEYYLSLVQKDCPFYPILMNEFIPALDKLGEEAFFSSKTLFPFMSELIMGLFKKGAIILSFD